MNEDACHPVSLILVIRNEMSRVKDVLDNFVSQKYPTSKKEIIVVDGNSTDGTYEVAREYCKKRADDGIYCRLFRNEKKILAAGWNIAITESTGDFVCRIDAHSCISDDYDYKEFIFDVAGT